MAAYEASGMTGRQFATYCGTKYSTLMSWVNKHRKRESGEGQEVAVGRRWVEAVVEREASREEEGLRGAVGIGGGRGRVAVRNVLYMAAVAASRWNPTAPMA